MVKTSIKKSELRVSKNVSIVAKTTRNKRFLLDFQRNLAAKGGVIMDGET